VNHTRFFTSDLAVFDICTDVVKQTDSGYIITPGYPSIVQGNNALQECRCRLRSNKDITITQLEGSSIPSENFICNKYKTESNSMTTTSCGSVVDDVSGSLQIVEVVMVGIFR
jgi:hypothetical protein